MTSWRVDATDSGRTRARPTDDEARRPYGAGPRAHGSRTSFVHFKSGNTETRYYYLQAATTLINWYDYVVFVWWLRLALSREEKWEVNVLRKKVVFNLVRYFRWECERLNRYVRKNLQYIIFIKNLIRVGHINYLTMDDSWFWSGYFQQSDIVHIRLKLVVSDYPCYDIIMMHLLKASWQLYLSASFFIVLLWNSFL